MPAFLAAGATLVVLLAALRGADNVVLIAVAGVSWSAAALTAWLWHRWRLTTGLSPGILAAVGVAFLLTASTVVTRWPLRVGAALMAPRLEALADRVEKGSAVTAGEDVGPFEIQHAGVERGFVCLWTDLHPHGRSGFVRGAANPHENFNAWSVLPLGRGWHFLIED